jgi:hypothetical protein
MSEHDDPNGLSDAWADRALDDEARASEHLTSAEPRERRAWALADSYVLADAWLVAPPDDPRMREWLIEEEECSPERAELVLDRMRELGDERGLT